MGQSLKVECLIRASFWQAVRDGAAAVVAVGGDGTLNEVSQNMSCYFIGLWNCYVLKSKE